MPMAVSEISLRYEQTKLRFNLNVMFTIHAWYKLFPILLNLIQLLNLTLRLSILIKLWNWIPKHPNMMCNQKTNTKVLYCVHFISFCLFFIKLTFKINECKCEFYSLSVYHVLSSSMYHYKKNIFLRLYNCLVFGDTFHNGISKLT